MGRTRKIYLPGVRFCQKSCISRKFNYIHKNMKLICKILCRRLKTYSISEHFTWKIRKAKRNSFYLHEENWWYPACNYKWEKNKWKNKISRHWIERHKWQHISNNLENFKKTPFEFSYDSTCLIHNLCMGLTSIKSSLKIYVVLITLSGVNYAILLGKSN